MAAGTVIGVDLGGTKALAAAVEPGLVVRHRARRMAREAPALALVERLVAELSDALDEPAVAVGVGIPSLVSREGEALWTNHLDLEGVAVRDVLAERLAVPVAVDNDANVALRAEAHAGAARGAADAVMLTLGTGIGGAVLCGGRVLRGARGAAGELGHVVVDLDGPPCPGRCPNRGCLEALASGTALGLAGAAAAAEGGALGAAAAAGREITGALVCDLAHDGDPGALGLVRRAGRHLGAGLAGIANALDPEVIVVGGGVMAAGELLLGPAREELAARALPPIAREVRVQAARFGEEAGVLGAALLAWEAAARG